jgi:hypothetical protein
VVRALGAAPAQGRVPRSAPALGGAGPRARCHPEDVAAGRLRLDLLGLLAGRGDSGAAGGEMLGPTVLGTVVAALVASMLLLQSGDEGSGAAPR